MNDPTRILFVGDIALNGDFARRYYGSGSDYTNPFSKVRPLFDMANIKVGNLEAPHAQGVTLRPKQNRLHAPPEAIKALKYLGFTSLNLANNHITDQGVESILKTRELLMDNGIECFGAGEDITTASQPALNRHGTRTFAFIGYAMDGGDVGAVIAGKSEGGCVPFLIDNIEKDVAALRSHGYHVIVSLHWGYQFDRLPSPDQIDMAHRIVDAGALIVHGHHPHVLQSIERYRNSLIMYSLGNFISPDFHRTDGLKFCFPASTRRTAAIICEIDESGVQSHSVFPLIVTKKYRVRPANGLRRICAERSLDSYSTALSMTSYDRHWSKHHARTRRVREQQERSIKVRLKLRLYWDQLSTEGCLSILKRLHGRHFGNFFYILWRYVTALLIRR